jgi:riboflavin kinase/FMN adenylyltransferase
MRVLEQSADAAEIRAQGCVVAIGTFDGVHLGHQKLISRAVELAREAGVFSVVFTFRNHPMSVIAPDREPLSLYPLEERRRVFEKLGVDFVIEEPFTAELAALAPENFLHLLIERLAPRAVIVGANFSFGAGGLGTPEFMAQRGQELGIRVEEAPLFFFDGERVSSTRIRALLAAGNVRSAGELLGHPFAIAGVVEHGDERGRKLGFPTVNITPVKGQALPADGVYAVRIFCPDGQEWIGVANVGDNPTFGGDPLRIEAHILDFSGDLYGLRLVVRFIERLRGEEKFPSAEALVRQIKIDEKKARELFAQ